jgi:hypothetical protein
MVSIEERQEYTKHRSKPTISLLRYSSSGFSCFYSIVSVDDLVEFLQRCKKALLPNGLICLKENIVYKRSVTDKEDSSITR